MKPLILAYTFMGIVMFLALVDEPVQEEPSEPDYTICGPYEFECSTACINRQTEEVEMVYFAEGCNG